MLACVQRVHRAVLLAAGLLVVFGLSGWCVDVGVLSSSKEGSPGSFVTHVFSVINDSSDARVYSLTFVAPSGWGVLGAPTSIALQPEEEGTLFVTVTIPAGAAADAYEVQLTAEAQSDSTDRGTASALVTVTPVNELELLPPSGASVAPGSSITYEFVLVNRGNVQDSLSIEATSSLDLPLSLSHTSVDLAPQERVTFTVRLDAPEETAAGRDVLTVTATSTLFPGVDTDAVVFTTVLPPPPDSVGGTVMEELPARIRLSMDKNVMTGAFDSRLSFSTSGQILGGYFSAFFSLLDPLGPTLAKISSFTMLYRLQPITFSIGSVSQQLTDLIRLSCTGGSLAVDSEYYALSMIGGGDGDETRFAGSLSVGPDVARVGFGYLGIRSPTADSQAVWTATAFAQPLEDWTLSLEGGLGLDGPLTSRAFFFNTTLDTNAYFFDGTVFSVGTYFPGQRADSAGIEVSQRLRMSALSLSVSLSHEWDNVIHDPLQPTRIQDNLGFNLSATPLADGPTLSSTISFTWDRYADLSVKDDLTSLFSAGLTETDGVVPYSLSGRVLEQIDRVIGTDVRTTTYSEGIGLSLDAFYMFLQLTQEQSVDLVTDVPLSSSSDVSLRFRPESALHEASITFSDSRDALQLAGSFLIRVTDDFDVTFDGSVGWDRDDASDVTFQWGISFDADVTIPLPFFVTKGRIEGRAFIDRDGDGYYGLNDEPIGGLVIGTEQTKVSTDDRGYFRFPPSYPGTFTIVPDGLPVDAAAGEPIPATVIAGETTWVDVPLSPIVVVSGDVFEDLNQDGMRSTDEGGFSQVRVVLTADDGRSLDAYTDLSGAFVISDVLPGTYTLTIDPNSLPDRFEFTTPDEVTLTVGASAPPWVSFGGYVREREVVITFQPPTADFTYTPQNPVAGAPVSFDGTDSFDFDGEIVAYAWDFNGDGQTDSTDAVTTYTFAKPGTYDVSLTVTDDSSNEDTVVVPVTVSGQAAGNVTAQAQPPVAAFSFTPAQPQAGESIQFDATGSTDPDSTITAYAWDFDANGSIDAETSVASYVFPSAGTYAISLTVVDNDGNSDTVTQDLVVASSSGSSSSTSATIGLPIADFQISPTTPVAGDTIQFNGTSSLDLDGHVEAFAWDFNDDGTIDSTAPIAEYRFGAAGSFPVTLTVTDDGGNSDSVTKVIQVVASPATTQVIPPVADFSYQPEAPTPDETVTFNGTLSSDPDGRIASYAWDFDADGVTDSTAAVADHTFVESGAYDVTLTVTDDSGASDTLTQQVIVGSPNEQASSSPTMLPPIADFDYSPAEPQTGSLVLFNGTLSSDPDGEVVSYAWDFDADGVIDSTAAISEFAFPAGIFDVSLTVTDDAGNTDTLTRSITVGSGDTQQAPTSSQPPVADFEYSPSEPVAGQPVLFNGMLSSDPDGEIVSYAWDFDGDGVIDAEESFVSHAFASPGTFDVSLTVTDNSGNSDAFIRAVLVGARTAPPSSPPSSFQPPIADFSYMPAQPMAGELVLFDASDSWDPDGEIVAYSWDFNSDGSPDADTMSAEHIFPEPGSATVSLTVTDNSGASDTLSIPIDVQ